MPHYLISFSFFLSVRGVTKQSNAVTVTSNGVTRKRVTG